MSGHIRIDSQQFKNSFHTIDSQSLSIALDQHITNTKQHIQINSFTLRFNEDCDEDVYKKYMGAELRYEWNLDAVIGIAFTAFVQITMHFALSDAIETSALKEALMIPLVYVPLIFLTSLVYFYDQEWISKNIQTISLLYVIFIGPVAICGKGLLLRGTFFGFVSCPYYITVLYCFCFFLRLQFLYCLGLSIVSIPAWFISATLSWKSLAGQVSDNACKID